MMRDKDISLFFSAFLSHSLSVSLALYSCQSYYSPRLSSSRHALPRLGQTQLGLLLEEVDIIATLRRLPLAHHTLD